MKKRIAIVSLAAFLVCSLQAQVSFNEREYSKAWETSQGGATIKEYLSAGETTSDWTTRLTLQAHPKAKKVREVSGPYFEARKSIVSLPPQLHPKKEGDFTDTVLELFLGAPGKTPHLEFVLARFIETDQGVYAAIYSHKIPLKSKKKNQDINVDEVMKSKDSWIKELLELSVDSIQSEF